MPVNPSNIIGEPFAIIAWSEDADGEDDVVVFSGTFIEEKGIYYLDRGNRTDRVEFQQDWLGRIQPVTKEFREMLLGCTYCVSLSVGILDETARDTYKAIGLTWPEGEA
jgi:hypothetical protein